MQHGINTGVWKFGRTKARPYIINVRYCGKTTMFVILSIAKRFEMIMIASGNHTIAYVLWEESKDDKREGQDPPLLVFSECQA